MGMICSLRAMEENKSSDIRLPLYWMQCSVPFDQEIFYSRQLFDENSTHDVPDFAQIESLYGMRIIENTSPLLAQLLRKSPQDPRFGIIHRYVQAVTLRLSLLPSVAREAHIEWARSVTTSDIRELDYIVDGKPSEMLCGKASTQGCQETLKEEFQKLLA